MPSEREYELKFGIDPRYAERLASHTAMPALEETHRLAATYFDTEDGALRKRGVSLRVRRSGDTVTQTVKRQGSSSIDREEWELEDADTAPDLDWLKSTPLRKLFEKRTVRTGLRPSFTVDVERSVFRLHHEGAEIEGALDRGFIRANGASTPVYEFELELKRGKPAAVLGLARVLNQDVPMVLSLASKSERGHGLVDGTWGHPIKAFSVRLRKGMSLARAFEAIVQACLHLFLLNADLIGGEKDVEAVHKARIALRRMRAAFELFRPVLRRKRYNAVMDDLKWMSKRLGEARDSDVFQEQLEAAVPKGNHGGRDLLDIMVEHRRQRRNDLTKALGSARWRLAILAVVDVSRNGVRRRRRSGRFLPFLQQRLLRSRRDLARRSRGLRSKPPEAMHDLRKRAKMLRYGLDFVAGRPAWVARRKRFARLSRDLQVLQETLGTIHDRDALHAHLRDRVRMRKDHRGAMAVGLAMSAAERLGSRGQGAKALNHARKAARRVRRFQA